MKLGLVSLNNLTLNFNDLFAFKGEMRHSSNVFFDKELLQALKIILGTKIFISDFAKQELVNRFLIHDFIKKCKICDQKFVKPKLRALPQPFLRKNCEVNNTIRIDCNKP